MSYEDYRLPIKIHNHCTDNPLPKQAHSGEWYDCYSADDIYLKAGDFVRISLGFSAELPQGYEAHICPRSSTFENWGIIQTNGIGIIDYKYCGDNDIWAIPVCAVRDTHIRRGDRICQFRLMIRQHPSYLVPVKKLERKDRGGFGSTGKR